MVAKDIVARQVQYMKSLPLEAASRVSEIQARAMEALFAVSAPMRCTK
jgi:hypothetical protein